MSRIYTATVALASVTAAMDVFEIPVSASQVIRVHSIFVGQVSDAGDANAQMLRALLRRGVGATSGSGGSTPTPRPHDTSWGAFSGTVEAGNTTLAVPGGGSIVTLLEETWNAQAGWYYTPTPEERVEFLPSEKIIVSIADAGEDFADSTADAIANGVTLSARITFEVLGAL